MLKMDLQKSIHIVQRDWGDILEILDPKRTAVLIDMTYNMGSFRAKFPKFSGYMVSGEYDSASKQLIGTKYHKQVGKRATRNACIIRDGKMYNKSNHKWSE